MATIIIKPNTPLYVLCDHCKGEGYIKTEEGTKECFECKGTGLIKRKEVEHRIKKTLL